MRQLASFLLLSVFGLGLLAGPHPCHAMRATQNDSMPACHAQQLATGAHQLQSVGSSDCCKGESGRLLCASTCEMTADFDARLALTVVSPVAPAVPPAFDRSLPLFAHAIDHVPLA